MTQSCTAYIFIFISGKPVPFPPKLPTLERRLLQRYLHASHQQLAVAQKLVELSFGMRNAHADIFVERDPLSAGARQVLAMADMLPLPRPTADRCNILLLRFRDANAELLNFNETVRMFFMMSDVRLIAGDMNDGEIPIFDMQGLTLMHFPRLVLSTLRLYMRYTQEAHPALVRQVHVINCSPFIDRCMAIAKPLIRSEVFKTVQFLNPSWFLNNFNNKYVQIHFHLPGSDTLDEFVPRELMPNEYGGKSGFLADIRRDAFEKLQQYRDYLMDRSRWQMRKPEPMRRNRAAELVGNFRALCID